MKILPKIVVFSNLNENQNKHKILLILILNIQTTQQTPNLFAPLDVYDISINTISYHNPGKNSDYPETNSTTFNNTF